MFKDLRAYIEEADKLGECKVIDGADWDLEVCAITEMCARPNTPLLVFDNIKGYPKGYRILTNLAASYKRINLLLGLPTTFEEKSGVQLAKSFMNKTGGAFSPVPCTIVDSGPVKENIHQGNDIDLYEFPAPRWHEQDGGRFIGTGDMVIVRDPETGIYNLGTQRVQIHDKNTATISMAPGSHNEIIRKKYWSKGDPCPVSVVCGQDPMLWLVSTSKIPWGISEYEYTGWLKGHPIAVTRGITNDLLVPSTAEIVLEGEILPPEKGTLIEGPFGEFSGYYVGIKPEPLFKINCILHRNNPILQGNPEFKLKPLYYWGRNILRTAEIWRQCEGHILGLQGVWIIEETAQMSLVLSIKQQYSGHVKDAALTAKTATDHLCKFIIVVDEDIDPSNISDVLWALGTRWDPETGTDIIRKTRGSRLDPLLDPEKRERGEFIASTAIIDACKPYYRIADFPAVAKTSDEMMMKTVEKWRHILQ